MAAARLIPSPILAVLALLCVSAIARAQEVSAADRTAIKGVITRQLEAFQRDDGPGAFSYAAPKIQKQFGTPEHFLDMVRQSYPSVYRPRSVEFTEVLVQDGQVIQQVELVGPGGETQLALYFMEPGPPGTWHISGCTLTRSTRVSA